MSIEHRFGCGRPSGKIAESRSAVADPLQSLSFLSIYAVSCNELSGRCRRVALQSRAVVFDLSDEQAAIQRLARDFAQQEVKPAAEELDREKRFPYEIVAKLGALGLMGVPYPEEYGGGGADALSYPLVGVALSFPPSSQDAGRSTFLRFQAKRRKRSCARLHRTMPSRAAMDWRQRSRAAARGG